MPPEPDFFQRMRQTAAATTRRARPAPSSSIALTARCDCSTRCEPAVAGPTYVSVHPSGRHLLVANYFGGSVAVLPILADGRLGDASDVKVDAGTIGPTRATHAAPGSFAFSGHDRTHAHMIQADPSGRFVLHADLGLDKIFIWRFDDQQRRADPNDPPSVALPPGDGPRHFDFHPNGRWLYSIQEEGSTIVLFDYDARSGRLTTRQTISTLPPGFAGSNFCSEILVSADGRYVYAGNRLHDSIGIFSVGADGRLTYAGEEWTRGNYPRSFNFDPTGRFLYCCNQRADAIAVFRVDRTTGGLSFTGQYVPVGNPSSIVFVDLAKTSDSRGAIPKSLDRRPRQPATARPGDVGLHPFRTRGEVRHSRCRSAASPPPCLRRCLCRSTCPVHPDRERTAPVVRLA